MSRVVLLNRVCWNVRPPTWITLLATVIVVALSPLSARAQIEVLSAQVGFRSQSGLIYRGGAYAPLSVQVRLLGGEQRNVFVQVEQQDRDGDFVVARELIGLTAGLEGPARVHWLYFAPNPGHRPMTDGLKLQILDEEGNALEVTHNQATTRKVEVGLPEYYTDDTTIVLDVTVGTASPIRALNEMNVEESRFTRPLRVAHAAPDGLPDHWHGLEMVDAIVWDGQGRLSLAQQDAILDWVRYGGRFVLAVSGGAEQLKGTRLEPFLPMEITGVSAVDSLPERLLSSEWRRASNEDVKEQDIDESVQVAECTAHPEAIYRVDSAGGTRTLAAERVVGRGRIAFVALALGDLFDAGADPVQFLQRRLCLRNAPSDLEGQMGFQSDEVRLFSRLHEPINFQQTTAVYLFVAFSFVIVYGLLATWGTWLALRRRSLLRLSWPVFAAAAVVASVISLIAVQVIRGVGRRVAQFTIVDSTVDTYQATAQCYFGYKTATMDEVDLWLPSEAGAATDPQQGPGFLRPLSADAAIIGDGGGFADTKRYNARTRRAVLDAVPIRATLKQLEGYWRGTMDGQVHASIHRRKDGTGGTLIGLGSTVTNALDHDLHSCFLIEALLEPTHTQTRNTTVHAYPLGDISAGRTLELDEIVHKTRGIAEEYKLKAVHKKCVDELRGGGLISASSFDDNPIGYLRSPQQALLLLTTFREYEPPQVEMWRQAVVHQTNGRWLDRSADLDRDHVMLIGFADVPGPVRLRAGQDGEYEDAVPGTHLTAYRILIPFNKSSGDD